MRLNKKMIEVNSPRGFLKLLLVRRTGEEGAEVGIWANDFNLLCYRIIFFIKYMPQNVQLIFKWLNFLHDDVYFS